MFKNICHVTTSVTTDETAAAAAVSLDIKILGGSKHKPMLYSHLIIMMCCINQKHCCIIVASEASDQYKMPFIFHSHT